VLQNVQRLEEAAATAYAALYDSPESALALARQAARRVDELCRIDPSLEGLREHLKAADLSLQEAAYGLRDYLSKLEANPQRLEEVEARLAALDRLKRKYGAVAGGGARVSGRGAPARSPPSRMRASEWKSCGGNRRGWPRNSKSGRRS
jgi:DNA repair ATPase RecN